MLLILTAATLAVALLLAFAGHLNKIDREDRHLRYDESTAPSSRSLKRAREAGWDRW